MEIAKTLTKKKYLVKGSVANAKNLKKLSRRGIKPYLLNFNPQLENSSVVADFFNTDALIIAVPVNFKKEKNKYFFILKEIIRYVELNGTKKVILISTTSVYDGPKSDEVNHVTENYPIKSDSLKTSLLLESEGLFLKARNHFKSTILRVAGLVGKNRNPKNYLSRITGKAANEYVNLVHFRGRGGYNR